MRSLLFTYIFLIASSKCTLAQTNNAYPFPDTVKNSFEFIGSSQSFINAKLERMNKLAKQQKKYQTRLLKKLKKQEGKLLYKLKKKDTLNSLVMQQSLSFDSLQKKQDLNIDMGYDNSTNSLILDSLKKIVTFVNQNIPKSINESNLIDLTKLTSVEQKLKSNATLDNLIQKRVNDLQSSSKQLGCLKEFVVIKKQAYYYNQKLNYYKTIAKDPTILEEKAFAYLQGVKGFDEALSPPNLTGSNSGSANLQQAGNIDELERMGFQTKRQVKGQLKQQMGMQTPEQLKELNAKVNEAKGKLTELKNQTSSIKNATKDLGFKPNPMRGMPLKERIEKNMNWQVLKSTSASPALFEMNASVGFKHTPRLTYAAVLGTTIGLGRNWQSIKFSFEGLRLGANIDWKWIWGISGQGGYERLYKQYQQQSVQLNEDNSLQQVVTQTKQYYDIAYTGLQKTYKLNSKYKGTMLLAYDWLWKQGNSKSPIIWRVGWKK